MNLEIPLIASEYYENFGFRLAQQSFVACYISYMKYNGSPWDAKLANGVLLNHWSDRNWKLLIPQVMSAEFTIHKGWPVFKSGQYFGIYEKLAEVADCQHRIHPADYNATIRVAIACGDGGLFRLEEEQTRELCLTAYKHNPTSFWNIVDPSHKKYVARHALIDVLKYVSQLGLSINAIAEIAGSMFVGLPTEHKNSHGPIASFLDIRYHKSNWNLYKTAKIWNDITVLAWHEIWAIADAVHRAGRTQC